MPTISTNLRTAACLTLQLSACTDKGQVDVDSDSVGHASAVLAPLSYGCVYYTDPYAIWLIECDSIWSDADAAALEGGTLTYTVYDASGARLSRGTPIIASTGNPEALLADRTVSFRLGSGDEPVGWKVEFSLTTADGARTSDTLVGNLTPQ